MVGRRSNWEVDSQGKQSPQTRSSNQKTKSKEQQHISNDNPMLQAGEGGPCCWLAATNGSTGRSRCQELDSTGVKPQGTGVSPSGTGCFWYPQVCQKMPTSCQVIRSQFLFRNFIPVSSWKNRHPRIPVSVEVQPAMKHAMIPCETHTSCVLKDQSFLC